MVAMVSAKSIPLARAYRDRINRILKAPTRSTGFDRRYAAEAGHAKGQIDMMTPAMEVQKELMEYRRPEPNTMHFG